LCSVSVPAYGAAVIDVRQQQPQNIADLILDHVKNCCGFPPLVEHQMSGAFEDLDVRLGNEAARQLVAPE